MWDRVTSGGEKVELTTQQAAAAEEFQRTWYHRHVALDSGRTSTWTSGLGVAQMVGAIVADAHELWPSSVVLQGEYGIDGVALSVPVRLGREGVEAIEEWELTAEQAEAMAHAASVVLKATDAIGAT